MTYLEKYADIIKQICGKIEPGKKMLQKLMYLIERKGFDLDLNYSIHFFGPYSSKLDNALHVLENFDAIKIDTSGMTHIIRAENKNSNYQLNKDEQLKVDFVLTNFADKTAHELEAITTLDYVATTMFKGVADDQQIINMVKQIKGTKFSQEYLEGSLKTLKSLNYL